MQLIVINKKLKKNMRKLNKTKKIIIFSLLISKTFIIKIEIL
jgi:hypothetical protein